jgi:hypothetical protein
VVLVEAGVEGAGLKEEVMGFSRGYSIWISL